MSLRAKAAYATRAGGAVVRDPLEGFERVRERVLAHLRPERRPSAVVASPDWHELLHGSLGFSWPCRVESEFEAIWSRVAAGMDEVGLALGKGTFGGWDDGDRAFLRGTYCLARNLRPATVLETGVAHGVSTRFLLEALERNGAGVLWSIDLPPLIDRDLRAEVAVAVPAALRDRWTYVRGSSRRRLAAVMQTLRFVDLFVHDSMHTERNVLFELERVWPALTDHGAIVVDDVDYNRGLERFVAATAGTQALLGAHEQGQRVFGVLLHA
jgi:predicted O-methyltransferase YrrM